jgi:phosphoserine phosphatase
MPAPGVEFVETRPFQYGRAPMTVPSSIILTVTGHDKPGIATGVFGAIDRLSLVVIDVEQIQVHGRLLLCVEIDATIDQVAQVCDAVSTAVGPDLVVSAAPPEMEMEDSTNSSVKRYLVTVLAHELGASALEGLFGAVAASGANVDRIVRLASYPIKSYELVVSGADADQLRRDLAAVAAELQIDVSVQQAGLHRRARHLIVLDADSTLLQGEVIDLLAAEAGHADEVARLTAAAMTGELDFEEALHQRVALLAGLTLTSLEKVRRELRLSPGARTLIRTLKRLGYETAVVSGGFVQLIDEVAVELGLDHVAANSLEIKDGKVTGRLDGPIIDRAGKAAALVRFAAEAGLPLSRTIAVGDGANDLDMLATAGLGIAFNAKPIVRDAADTALTVPYLDAILFLLGISREEVEAADREPLI